MKGIETFQRCLQTPSRFAQSGLVGVSRLKGIETALLFWIAIFPPLSLVGVSRLKGIETVVPSSRFSQRNCQLSLNTHDSLVGVSRLKGIETQTSIEVFALVLVFGRSFPFEGN